MNKAVEELMKEYLHKEQEILNKEFKTKGPCLDGEPESVVALKKEYNMKIQEAAHGEDNVHDPERQHKSGRQ